MRLLLLAVLAASAQAPAPSPPASDVTVTLRMLDLPIAARSLRAAGVPEADVKSSLDAMKSKGLSAGEAEELVQESADAAKAHGPVDNFGAFVQAELDAGLRGRELAAAIQAEHLVHGAKHAGTPGADGEHGKDAEIGRAHV